MNIKWQQYRELELIPPSTPEPQSLHLPLTESLERVWRSRVEHRIETLAGKQQADHLERCWALGDRPKAGFWVLLWQGLQPLLRHSNEPEVQRITDGEGRHWWCAYDPRTGQKTYMESEEEVQVWLEERLYFG